MRNSRYTPNWRPLIILGATLGALVALPLLSNANSPQSTNIVNNSSRQILHVYLSPVDADNWTADQLGGTTISPGQTFNLSNYSCNQQIKLIAEDQEGCFLSTVVTCGGDATWTITNDTAADCGQ